MGEIGPKYIGDINSLRVYDKKIAKILEIGGIGLSYSGKRGNRHGRLSPIIAGLISDSQLDSFEYVNLNDRNVININTISIKGDVYNINTNARDWPYGSINEVVEDAVFDELHIHMLDTPYIKEDGVQDYLSYLSTLLKKQGRFFLTVDKKYFIDRKDNNMILPIDVKQMIKHESFDIVAFTLDMGNKDFGYYTDEEVKELDELGLKQIQCGKLHKPRINLYLDGCFTLMRPFDIDISYTENGFTAYSHGMHMFSVLEKK